MKYAIIDIGTNSCRLYVADVIGDKQEKIIKDLRTTRLGDGITRTHRLENAPVERTLNAIDAFVRTARDAGVENENLFLYATAVVREAENRDVCCRAVLARTGQCLTVLPGEAEGEIAYVGAAEGKDDCAVLDIGGGSTEMVMRDGGTLCALSQKIGCVRLKELFPSEDGRVDTQPVKDYVLSRFIPAYGQALPLERAERLVGVSGTPTTFASLLQGRKEYDASAVQDYILSLDALEEELAKMARMTACERARYAGAFAPRADIIVYGGCLLTALMRFYGFFSLTVSDRDSLEGFLSLVLAGKAPFLSQK